MEAKKISTSTYFAQFQHENSCTVQGATMNPGRKTLFLCFSAVFFLKVHCKGDTNCRLKKIWHFFHCCNNKKHLELGSVEYFVTAVEKKRLSNKINWLRPCWDGHPSLWFEHSQEAEDYLVAVKQDKLQVQSSTLDILDPSYLWVTSPPSSAEAFTMGKNGKKPAAERKPTP